MPVLTVNTCCITIQVDTLYKQTHTASRHTLQADTHCKQTHTASRHTPQADTHRKQTHTASRHTLQADTHCKQTQTTSRHNTWLRGYCWLYSCFTSGLDLLSCRHPDSGCRSAQGYSVFQTLPSLFAPPLSPPTNYQTEGSGARLPTVYIFAISAAIDKACLLRQELKLWSITVRARSGFPYWSSVYPMAGVNGRFVAITDIASVSTGDLWQMLTLTISVHSLARFKRLILRSFSNQQYTTLTHQQRCKRK